MRDTTKGTRQDVGLERGKRAEPPKVPSLTAEVAQAVPTAMGLEKRAYPNWVSVGLMQPVPFSLLKAWAKETSQGWTDHRRMLSLGSDVRVIPNSFGYSMGPLEPSSGMLFASGLLPRASSAANSPRCKHGDFIRVLV